MKSSSGLVSSVDRLYPGGRLLLGFTRVCSTFLLPRAPRPLLFRGKYQIRLPAPANIRRVLLLPALVIQFTDVLEEKERKRWANPPGTKVSPFLGEIFLLFFDNQSHYQRIRAATRLLLLLLEDRRFSAACEPHVKGHSVPWPLVLRLLVLHNRMIASDYFRRFRIFLS